MLNFWFFSYYYILWPEKIQETKFSHVPIYLRSFGKNEKRHIFSERAQGKVYMRNFCLPSLKIWHTKNLTYRCKIQKMTYCKFFNYLGEKNPPPTNIFLKKRFFIFSNPAKGVGGVRNEMFIFQLFEKTLFCDLLGKSLKFVFFAFLTFPRGERALTSIVRPPLKGLTHIAVSA